MKNKKELYHVNQLGEKVVGANPDMSNASAMWGDCTEISGDCSGVNGDCSGLWGDFSYIEGTCTDLKGDCTGVTGSFDDIPEEDIESDPEVWVWVEQGILEIENK